MPLFKKHNAKHDQATSTSVPSDGARMDPSLTRNGAGAGTSDFNSSAGTDAGMGSGMNPMQSTTYNPQEAGVRSDQGYNSTMPMGDSRMMAGGNYGLAGQPGQPMQTLPSTSHYGNASGQSQHGHGASRAAGKVEHAVGVLVGSNALKTRGLEKEQEANAFKMQSTELAEAERLEREAMLRRERAVAHGAHPVNRQLGGSSNTAALQ
ncbi:hypothetical protein K488DRAFT_86907 [Vararia minispora EC-137]|uniref:Uncharacterized protein n=1 Tax=Vararia minispora EC-137 TaxID=1314806 RepID=A0ACB8QIG0_9AGAM|nr:hypothetical protein K488DRAFT_86907 [Vararia minispora EC-137]